MSDDLNTATAQSITAARAIKLYQYAEDLAYFEARVKHIDDSLRTRLSELRSMIDTATDDQLDEFIGETQMSHDVYELLRDDLEVLLETVVALTAKI